MTPYTYLIGWSVARRFYYGVRFARCCDPSDLWVTYFTSSKLVAELRKELGEPDVVQVRRTFDSGEAARTWEVKVLRRLRVVLREDFLNQTIGTEKFNHGRTHTEATRKLLSEKIKGKPREWKLEHFEKLREAARRKSPEHRAKLSQVLSGKSKSPEHRAAISAARTGVKRGPYKKRQG